MRPCGWLLVVDGTDEVFPAGQSEEFAIVEIILVAPSDEASGDLDLRQETPTLTSWTVILTPVEMFSPDSIQ